ncbi:MAG TPA: helix-turn-helix transcriptional regulator, partial [Acidimicrobiia bacterium]|nr:helix-turn-helix transcriptional regulator [Acidimicrobiia bacterium]
MAEERFWFDPLVFGKRLRHYRKTRGLTLQQLGDRVGKQASFLSMLEGGKREPRPALVDQLAQALDVSTADLLRADPPDKRSRLEVAVERVQDEPLYQRLRLPPLKMAAGIPDTALEHVLGLYSEL